MANKSKKLLKVIDGIRSWNISSTSPNTPVKSLTVEESLRSDNFQIGKISIHGFPYQASCIAFDPVQKLLAVGTKSGSIRIFGRPGVDCCIHHPSNSAVVQIFFLVNEGGMISICNDDVTHLWNIRQKNPDIVHSLQFKRERLMCGHLSVGSNWLYLGTDKGNVHFVCVQGFTISGYVINWNKAIELSQSTHPGAVIQISENPVDSNKILIGYASGLLVLWDLRNKLAEVRFKHFDNLNGLSWHWEGRNFLTCHNHGLLAFWSCKQPQNPQSISCPHAGGETIPDDVTSYDPINFIEWLPAKTGDPYIIFSGGGRSLDTESNNQLDESPNTADGLQSCCLGICHSLTVKRGKRLVVMQLDHKLVQFISLCSSPYPTETMDPYAIAVLLKEDLIVIDLLSRNYATFENPYPMDLHSSPVTSCLYLVDCPPDLIPAFYSVGTRRNRNPQTITTVQNEPEVFSAREWPITGGEMGSTSQSYPELILTGHADGSIRFWDASEVTLTPLYKFRTSKLFGTNAPVIPASHPSEADTAPANQSSPASLKDLNAYFSPILLATESDPFAIRLMHFCSDSRQLLTASLAHVCLLHFSRREHNLETAVIDVNMLYDTLDDFCFTSVGSGDAFFDDHKSSTYAIKENTAHQVCNTAATESSRGESLSSVPSMSLTERDLRVFVPIRQGNIPWPAGYQPVIVCRIGFPGLSFDSIAGLSSSDPMDSGLIPPPYITAISLNSAFGLFAIGSDFGISMIDYAHRTCLICVSSAYLLGRTPTTNPNQPSNIDIKSNEPVR